MLAIILLIFAGMSTLGTLAIAASTRIKGGTAVWLVSYNVGLIVSLVLAAIQLMN